MTRRPRGEWFWQAMVAACGNHCCGPDCKVTGPLEQGHIEPHGDGHGDDPENLIPLCRKCNAKYKKLRTPEGRPEGWRERFMQLIGYSIQPKFITVHENLSCYLKTASERTDSNEVILWQKPEFDPKTELFTSSQVTRRTAVLLVEQIKREAEKKNPSPYLPKANRGAQLVKLAEGDPDTFLLTCREFLLRKHFQRDDGAIRDDSWGPLCDNYLTYKEWDAERRAEQNANAERVRQEREENQRQRTMWNFREVLTVPTDWPGLTAADLETIEWVKTHENPNADEMERSQEVMRRYRFAISDAKIEQRKLEDTRKRMIYALERLRATDDKQTPDGCAGWVNRNINTFDNVLYGITKAKTTSGLLALEPEVKKMLKAFSAGENVDPDVDPEQMM